MENYKRFRVVNIHICCFDRGEKDKFKLDFNKYPTRLCVIDEEKEVAIDVETMHQYPYIKTVGMLDLLDDAQAKKVKLGQRAAVVEYIDLTYYTLDSKTLIKCENIINCLKQGIDFPDGNKELTNEQYLKMLRKQKNDKYENSNEKSKKKCKKRK